MTTAVELSGIRHIGTLGPNLALPALQPQSWLPRKFANPTRCGILSASKVSVLSKKKDLMTVVGWQVIFRTKNQVKISYTDTQCAECFQGLKHVACLCKRVILCQSSSSQLYLPSRVQSPGSFEQKSLITRPSVLSSCSWIQHHHVSFMLRRTQQPSNQQYASICHIHPHPMIGLGWQVIFRTKNQVKISYTDTQCAECFQGLKHVACLCKRVILCQSSSSQLYLPSRVQSPGSFEQKNLITRPSVLSSCSWIQHHHVSFMLRRTQQPSNQQYASICHIHPHPMIGLGWQVIFRTKNQVKISYTDTQCAECFQGLKHVACLCKRVILCQSSSSQLYLPSRVQSPGSFEQKNLITRPSVLSSCSWIQLHHVSFMLRRTQQPSNQQYASICHIHPHPMIGLGWQVIFRTKNQVKISYTDTQCAECFQGLKHVACLCKRVILCQSSSSQLYLPSRVQSPGSFEQKSLITRPSVLSSCSWIQHHHVSFMLRRTQQPSNQQYASICHIHPHPMIGLGWQVIFRTKNQVKISYTDTQCAECFQGLKHVACLCKRVILCQSSSSQLYLPSRVQSPGSFEQKSLITRPSVLSSCSWIQLHHVSFMLRRTQQPSNQQYASICHIHPHPMIGLGWQVIFRTKNQVKISYTDTQCAECFQGLKHVACLCKRVILCQSSSSQLYLPSRVQSPGSFEQKSLITRPSVLSSCSWIQLHHVSFMLRRTQQPSNQQYASICHIHPHPMIGLGWQVIFRTKNQVKISYTDTQCAECFQGLKHVACLCKRVILCQSSSSQLYLPSRVQSPGSFEQKSLITRPSVLSSCSWIQLQWMSNSLASNFRWCVFTLLTCPAVTYSKGWSWNISSCAGQAGAATWTTTSSCRNGTERVGRVGRRSFNKFGFTGISVWQNCSNLVPIYHDDIWPPCLKWNTWPWQLLQSHPRLAEQQREPPTNIFAARINQKVIAKAEQDASLLQLSG